MRGRCGSIVVGLVLAAGVAPGSAIAQTVRVVPPDMAPVLERMFPPGAADQPAGMEFLGVRVERDRVVVQLRPGATAAPIEVALAAGASESTLPFALADPAAPDPLGHAAAVLALANARGASFRWLVAGADPGVAAGAQGTAAGSRGSAAPIDLPGLATFDAAWAAGDDSRAAVVLATLRQAWPPERTDPHLAWELAVRLESRADSTGARDYLHAAQQRLAAAAPRADVSDGRVRAAVQYALGDEAGARATLATCVATTRASPTRCGLDALATLAEARRDWSAAARLRDEMLGDGAGADAGTLAARAALAGRLGDLNGERRWAERAVQRSPDDPGALTMAASVAFRAGAFEDAMRSYERLYRLDPQRPGTLGHLSGVFNRMGGAARTGTTDGKDYARVVEGLRVRAVGGDIVARFLLAVAKFYEQRFDDAIADLTTLARDLPHEARVPIYLAMAHHWLGNATEAERFSAEAVRIGPADPDVYYVRSQVRRARDPHAAADDLERYIRMSEHDGAIHFRDKTERVRKELDALRRGELPPAWDHPGGPEAVERLRGPGRLALVGGLWWLRRRGARRGPHSSDQATSAKS